MAGGQGRSSGYQGQEPPLLWQPSCEAASSAEAAAKASPSMLPEGVQGAPLANRVVQHEKLADFGVATLASRAKIGALPSLTSKPCRTLALGSDAFGIADH